MRVKEFPLKELNKRALRAIAKELGPAGLIRFLQQYEGGSGDYTKRRHEILDNVTEEDIAADLRKVQEELHQNPRLRQKIAKKAVRRKTA